MDLTFLQNRSFTKKTYKSSVPLVFMHIPKTGGVALSKALLGSLQPLRALDMVFDRVLFGDFVAFDSIHPDIRRTIYLTAIP